MPATTSQNIQQILAPEAIERQIQVIRDPYIYEDLCDFQNIGAAAKTRHLAIAVFGYLCTRSCGNKCRRS